MYKNLLCFFLTIFINAQVGINTLNPKATLDVSGNPNAPTIADGIIPPRLTLEQLYSKKDSYGSDHKGAMILVTEINLDPVLHTDTIVRYVTSPGYHYFDGTIWNTLEPKTGNVFFNVTANTPTYIISNGWRIVNLNNVKSNIGGGTWNPSTRKYKIPTTGTYLISANARVDISNDIPRSYFIGVNTAPIDIPEGIWNHTGLLRNTLNYIRIAFFRKDEEIMLYMHPVDSNFTILNSSMTVKLLSPYGKYFSF
jgi:hypothetical protein